MQTQPVLRARVGPYLCECKEGAVTRTAQKVQALIKEARHNTLTTITFHTLASAKKDWRKVRVVTFGDASHVNRPRSGSTGGTLTLLAGPDVENGAIAQMTMIAWKLRSLPILRF